MMTSVHHYELAASAAPADFRDAVAEAVERGLFERVPALTDYRILRGVKGDRADAFAAVWTYESREAWEAVWGPADDPVPKSEYPDAWVVWEDELLEPLLAEDPDRIEFTSYETVAAGGD